MVCYTILQYTIIMYFSSKVNHMHTDFGRGWRNTHCFYWENFVDIIVSSYLKCSPSINTFSIDLLNGSVVTNNQHKS